MTNQSDVHARFQREAVMLFVAIIVMFATEGCESKSPMTPAANEEVRRLLSNRA
jgi:hypothetical protein